jgi:hypothetical protein
MGFIRALAVVWAMAGILVAGPAEAAWRRVETAKFVVYGEGNERAARDLAIRLTTYDTVLRRFHPSTLDRKPGTKVQVFLVNSQDDLRRIRPRLDRRIGGFYSAMNEGVFAVALKDAAGLGADDVLFHEYAHHFMLENFPAAYPAWFVEGWAEYFATTEITPSQIKIGGYSQARAYGIFRESWVPLEDLLSKTSWEIRPERRSAYYAQAWLLTHYMRSDPLREKQLNSAITAIANGEDPVKAFQKATGMTMEEITLALRKYQRLPMLGIANPGVLPAMKETALPKSADDLLLDNLRLTLSTTGQVDTDFLAGVRRKAARYPDDPFAQLVLARAEFVMGDVAAGEAIVERRLAADPKDAEALLLAGLGQVMAGMRDPPNKEARYRAARPLFGRAYQIDKGDFRTLYAYALSRSLEPTFPTDNDIAALTEAHYLAPSVQEISFRAGMALLKRGKRDEAAIVLAPVINNPHGGRAAAQARTLLSQGRIGVLHLDEPEDDEDEKPEPAPPAKVAGPAR